MRILIASDAAEPQVNGVVRVFETTRRHLEADGHVVRLVGPGDFGWTVPAPGYREVRLALPFGGALGRAIGDFAPDAIHIPVEGPIGLAARAWCRRRALPFTTSFHTRFGDYFAARLGFGTDAAYALQRWFHNGGNGFMVQTPTLERQLGRRGFANIRRWGRAVDTTAFRPHREEPGFDADFLALPRPIFLYVGRVSAEKSLERFFSLDLPGSKVVVGDGPARKGLQAAFPAVHFLGYRHGEDLARHMSAADVFVFPSRFETFGLVVLEALACGTPVAAYPVQGPADILGDAPHGVLSEDLRGAALQALGIDRAGCRRFAETFSWTDCTRQFAANLVPISGREGRTGDGR
ncbi:alpha-mannosyltransferase [Aureimonas sp. Leaf454]|uniref:glycosyltransferase family 4 protein n=1 Tax=Aureimonas sp. Leaf454 TaxID=1736381 RepID=UPI0006FE38A0|nr:glycosyltransferase family 1 protein [Aureimonas sp. Leaf454]KQT47538.1 alpha-mannosyltransferase [Aureimonas sp. Leaf454]